MSLSAPKRVTAYVAAVLWLLAVSGMLFPAIDGVVSFGNHGLALVLALASGLLLMAGISTEKL